MLHLYLHENRVVEFARGLEIKAGYELSPSAEARDSGGMRTGVLVVTDAEGNELGRFVEKVVEGWAIT